MVRSIVHYLSAIFVLGALSACSAAPPPPNAARPKPTVTAVKADAAPPSTPAVRVSEADVPFRVLIALEYDTGGEDFSAAIATINSKISGRLEAVGFTVLLNDPILKTSKSLDEAANKLQAGFIATGKITLRSSGEDKRLLEFDGLTSRCEVHRVGEEPHNKHLHGVTVDNNAMGYGWLGDTLRNDFFWHIVTYAGNHPALQKMAASNAKWMRYLEVQSEVYAESKSKQDRVAQKFAEGNRGPGKITLHSQFDDEDRLRGVAAAGVLVERHDFVNYINWSGMKLGGSSLEGRLEWIQPSGERKLVWSGWEFIFDAAIARGTEKVVFWQSMTFHGPRKLMIAEAGKPLRHVPLDPKLGIPETLGASLSVAPGGQLVALLMQPCSKCKNDLVVISLDDGHEVHRLENDGWWSNARVWLDAHRLAVFSDDEHVGYSRDMRGDVNRPQRVQIIDIGSPKPSIQVINRPSKYTSWEWSSASGDGNKILFDNTSWNPDFFHMVDTTTRKISSVYVGENPGSKSTLSPDGKYILFKANDPNTFKLQTFEIATRKSRTLATSAFPTAQYSEFHFSPDGERVYFELEPHVIGSVALKDAGSPQVIKAPMEEPMPPVQEEFLGE